MYLGAGSRAARQALTRGHKSSSDLWPDPAAFVRTRCCLQSTVFRVSAQRRPLVQGICHRLRQRRLGQQLGRQSVQLRAQPLQDRYRLCLSQAASSYIVQGPSSILDFVEASDHFYNQCGFYRRRRPRLEELSARVRPAGHLDNRAVGARVNPVIPAERICLQVPRVDCQEPRWAIALTIGSEVIDIVREGSRADVDPESPLVAPFFFASQYRHRCIVGPDHASLSYQLLLKLVERLQELGNLAHPIAERAPR